MTWLHLLKKLLRLYCHDTKYILFKIALYCNNWFVFFFWCFSLIRSHFLKSGTIKGGSMPYHPGPLVVCKLILIQFCSYSFVVLYSPTQSHEILALFNLGRVLKYLLCAKKWATHYTNQCEWETKMNSMSKIHNLVGDTIKQHKLYMASARRYVYTALCGGGQAYNYVQRSNTLSEGWPCVASKMKRWWGFVLKRNRCSSTKKRRKTRKREQPAQRHGSMGFDC